MNIEMPWLKKAERNARIGFVIFAFCMLCGFSCLVGIALRVTEEVLQTQPKQNFTCTKETYNGHDYLFFKQNIIIRGIRGVVHDPDCVKCKASAKPTKPKPQTDEHQYYIMPTTVETAPAAKK